MNLYTVSWTSATKSTNRTKRFGRECAMFADRWQRRKLWRSRALYRASALHNMSISKFIKNQPQPKLHSFPLPPSDALTSQDPELPRSVMGLPTMKRHMLRSQKAQPHYFPRPYLNA
ncbi:hypothetical protein N7G274_002583 [Stereocaulon virgatum]|uniref:Uncharacterized protein n=1 Tax=Stereocaulon virgatum TaxID=373712 RepID=A0ABR4AI75_9LECA